VLGKRSGDCRGRKASYDIAANQIVAVWQHAIAAESLNEIDPYQSQLLEALSLSVTGKTGSRRRERKRSLLPPTMVQVPYVVQKCCDHITKYGEYVIGQRRFGSDMR